MKHLKLILVLVFFSGMSVFSQKTTKHTITKGETISSIAEKYNIKPSDIYKINPKARKTLQLKQVLLIPNQKGISTEIDPETTNTGLTHKVLVKETVYGITRKYKITAEAFHKANPTVEKEGLKVDQLIIIPGKEAQKIAATVKKEVPKQTPVVEPMVAENKVVAPSTPAIALGEELIHEVLPKETKYGIAKKYGITVATLEKQNPEVLHTLPVGFKLVIRNPSDNYRTAAASNDRIAVKSEKESILKDTISITKYSNTSELAEQLIKTASENIGTKYRTGGTTSAGFDCSGLMCSTYGTFDIKLPRSSHEQAGYGQKITFEEARKGDLIFFKTNGRNQINHVGMVVEVNEGEIKFIHSSNHGGVIISSTKEAYYEKNVVQVNRVLL